MSREARTIRSSWKHATRACGLVAAAVLVSSARPASAQEWEYRAAIYAWLSGMDGTIALTPAGGGIPVAAKFSDLAGFLDFAAAGHFEAQNPKLVFLGDVNFVGLGADRDADVDGEGSTADETTHTWADVFLGARWTKPLGERRWLSLRGDIGTGGSSIAWFGDAAFGYRFSHLVSLGLAYRILSLDYETGSVVGGDYYEYDVALNGLGLVLAFTF